MKILVYTVSRASTPTRGKMLFDTLSQGRDTAGTDFDWHVYCNSTMAAGIAESAKVANIIQGYKHYPHNVGQHPPTNEAIAKAIAEDYTYIVRVDDDIEWITKRWLARLTEASVKLEDRFILSPTVLGLRHPPQTTHQDIDDLSLRFLDDPLLGGICRLIPVAKLKEYPYVSDVRLTMGLGDASGVGAWGRANLVFAAYLDHIRVRHAKGTAGQEATDSGHFEEHGVFQHVPYIPPWTATV